MDDPKDKQMDESKDKQIRECLKCILRVCVSPMATVFLILMVLESLLQFLSKVALLFIIVVISTPFAVMCNVSILVFEYYIPKFLTSSAEFRKSHTCFKKQIASRWNWSDPRASVGEEIQIIVSDFFKVIAPELLLVISTGIITFYTAPRLVFYISTGIWLVSISHKWLNEPSLSKTALSCLCGGYGLNPMMFLFSFIGFFNIGCHPVAKCSFVASRAFLFDKDKDVNDEYSPPPIFGSGGTSKKFSDEAGHYEFSGARLEGAPTDSEQHMKPILFKWNAFERGLFQLIPKIDFIDRNHGDKHRYTLKSCMVFKVLNNEICEYPVETLELPEDYPKPSKLYYFLCALTSNEGFVTDKMQGRYEHSLTLSQIADGVQKNTGFTIVDPVENVFVVAGRID